MALSGAEIGAVVLGAVLGALLITCLALFKKFAALRTAVMPGAAERSAALAPPGDAWPGGIRLPIHIYSVHFLM